MADLNPALRRRALTVIALVATLGAGGLVYAAVASDDAADTGEVVLSVENVKVPVPSTVAPLATEPSTASPSTRTPSASPVTEAAPIPEAPADQTQSTNSLLSPLADLLGEPYSAIPEETAPRPRPVGIEIDTMDVSRFPIRAVGLEDDGQLEVPDETEIGWYQYGATSGQPGATVLAAHVSWNRTVGPFGALGSLDPGNQIAVTLDDGTTRQYEVFERAIYGKLELPRERIWRNTGPETLVLITCGGDFNPDIRRYAQNIVVYAAPVA